MSIAQVLHNNMKKNLIKQTRSVNLLPHDAILHSADYAVRPSVRHTPVLYRNGKSFSPSDSHTILVFPYLTIWQYYDWDLPNGGVECRGVKNRDFRPVSRFITEMIQDRAMVTVEGE